ncbi:MAG: thioesterase family protein [Deltaproteobacteria bacterium]|nr:thioesterase family protein [Nannocystaceae bacterium]
MSEDLSSFITPERIESFAGGARFRFEVRPGWAQGRGAFGGLVLGTMVRAIETVEPEPERRLRSLTAELVGPTLVGPCDLEVTELRRGNGVSSWHARVLQQGQVTAIATAVLAKTRDVLDRRWSPQGRAAVKPAAEVDAIPMENPFAPEFARHFEYRLVGPFPFSGAAEPTVTGWVRPRAAPAKLGAAEVVAIADAWWPAVFSTERGPRPIATIAFTLQSMLGDRELPGDEPLLHRASSPAAGDGFFVEHRELWTADGELVAMNEQTFVWIK